MTIVYGKRFDKEQTLINNYLKSMIERYLSQTEYTAEISIPSTQMYKICKLALQALVKPEQEVDNEES